MDNPLGIHCTTCTVDAPCEACTRQIVAETMHYHWGQNIPGYLPMADEPNLSTEWETARSCLLEDLERAGDMADLDDYAPGWGNSWEEACEEIRGASAGEEIYVNVCSDDPHDLGVSYWLTICAEDECRDAMEELD